MKRGFSNPGDKTRGIRSVKEEIRVLAIKDVPLDDPSKPLWIVGVVFRGRYWLDGVMRTQIPAEEFDATQSLADMIRGSPHHDQIRVIMMDNILLRGRKLVDINELYEKTLKPVIVLMERIPSYEDLQSRHEKGDFVSRVLEKMGKETELSLKDGGKRFMWSAGLSSRVAERIVKRTAGDGEVPEAMRVAKLITYAFLHVLLNSKV